MPKLTHAKGAFIQRLTALAAIAGLTVPLLYSVNAQAETETDTQEGTAIIKAETVKAAFDQAKTFALPVSNDQTTDGDFPTGDNRTATVMLTAPKGAALLIALKEIDHAG